jgi:hypothetical protein
MCVEAWDDASLPAGILQAVGFVKKKRDNVKSTRLSLGLDAFVCWPGNIPLGKVFLGGSRPHCEGAMRADALASDAALSPEIED